MNTIIITFICMITTSYSKSTTKKLPWKLNLIRLIIQVKEVPKVTIYDLHFGFMYLNYTSYDLAFSMQASPDRAFFNH